MRYILFFLLTVTTFFVSGQTPQLVLPKQKPIRITSLGFSSDGKYLLTGFRGASPARWNLSDNTFFIFKVGFIYSHSRSGSLVAFSPDGKYIFFDDRIISQVDNTFKILIEHPYDVESVTFSPDGKYILICMKQGPTKLLSIDGHYLRSFEGIGPAIFSPDGNLILTTDKSGKNVDLWDINGKKLNSFQGHAGKIVSLSFSPDGKTILTGSMDRTARSYNLSGEDIHLFTGHTGAINSVTFSPDGKQILTGSSDHGVILWDLKGNKIRSFGGENSKINLVICIKNDLILTVNEKSICKIWNSKSGQELASLSFYEYHGFNMDDFYHLLTDPIRKTDWIITTPSGLFDASPTFMDSISYTLDQETLALDQLKQRYYEPGLLHKITNGDKIRSTKGFDNIALFPLIKPKIEKNWLNVEIVERNGGIGKLSIFINGKEVQEDINPKRLKNIKVDLSIFTKYYLNDTINELILRSYNQEGWLKSKAYQLHYQPTNTEGNNQPQTSSVKSSGKTKPRFFAIVIGTSDYVGDRLDLRFADLDAEAIAKALYSTSSALFGSDRTLIHLLSTASKTAADVSERKNISNAFIDVADRASPVDVLVVYFSGHGIAYGPAEKEQFYYLTKDISSEDLSDPVIRDNYAISSDTLTKWLNAIPAQKQVMIIDACNAGKVVESLAAVVSKDLSPSQIRALDRMKDRTGMFILTGSAADKVSYEASQYGQGLLTYSLLQGMSGLALKDGKYVDVMTLFQYTCDKVPDLAKGIGGVQTPVLAFPKSGASFDIGMVTADVRIPVAQVKPVFIRNNFQDEATFDDVLGLTSALADYFRGITAKGAQATMIYVDVSEYENAYSMKGRYTIKGDALEVHGRLFKGKESKGEFQVTGNKNDLSGLVQSILDKVKPLIK